MKRLILCLAFAATGPLLLQAGASLTYSLQSVTATTININCQGSIDVDPATYSQYATHLNVYLESGGNLFYCGEFYNCVFSCSTAPPNYNTSCIAPVSYTGPFTFPCDGATSRVASVPLPVGCIPSGSYRIKLYASIHPPFPSLPISPYVSFNIGGSMYSINGITDDYLLSGDLGITTVTGGSSFVASVTPANGTCSSFPSITFNVTAGLPSFTMGVALFYNSPGIPTVTTSSYSYTYTGLTPGFYFIYIKDATGCRRDFIITLSPPAMPTVNCTKSPTQPTNGYCKNTCVTLNATPSTGTGYTYSWTRNGSAISTNQSFCNKPGPTPTTTTYAVSISNIYGCTASGSVSTLTDPACLGALNACCSNVGHRIPTPDDTAYVAVQVFPNPASEVVNVQFADPAAYGTVLEFTDITGKVVRHVEVPEGAECYTMDVSDLPAGVYLANIIEQDVRIISSEFVIE